MSKEVSIYTKKQLKKLVSELCNQRTDMFQVSMGSDFFQEVMEAIGAEPKFLVEEIVNNAIKEVINEKSRVDLPEEQPDFFGYGDKLIKLPDNYVVRVEVATLDHMQIQKQILVDNYLKQTRAFVKHHDGIVMPIIRTMTEHQLSTAGEAIRILCP